MRITGGQARGIQLCVPKGKAVRPATDRMREAVFSRLGAGIEGARVLDLFAGSGSYGLEALSRGAASVTFVERDQRTRSLLSNNLLGVKKAFVGAGQAVVFGGDALTAQVGAAGFDFIFADPPYELWPVSATALFDRFADLLAAGGQVVAESPGGQLYLPPGWECVRRLGDVGGQGPGISFLRKTD
ncbi:MAG: RsmD family RNA methyltransferase [Opitutales bacterium]|nr:RsmD family RNA methyltransferase [Opitutales bacterium]